MKIPDVVRVYHRWDQWECAYAGMYDSKAVIDEPEKKERYVGFFSCNDKFQRGIDRVFTEWTVSCENFLTNQSINRIAWIGQAAVCIELGLCSGYKGWFWMLSEQKQSQANALAFYNLSSWIGIHNANKTVSRAVRNGVGTQMLFRWDT